MFREKRAIALGFFDGIHIGHAALLQRLVEVSVKEGLKPTVLSFDTLPQNLIENKNTAMINSPEDRMWLILRRFRIDDIAFLPFDKKMAAMTWESFFDVLIDEYSAKHLIAGRNYRFGKGAAGNAELLKQKCLEQRIGCDIVEDVMLDGIVSSSTYIRELLLAGDIERANAFLGHPHTLTGFVENGNRLGSKLGTPTINMSFPPGVLVPKHGVYATKVFGEANAHWVIPKEPKDFKMPPKVKSVEFSELDGSAGVTNIGVRPTVDTSGKVTVETHIPGYSKNLYGQKIRIEFYRYLRPEMKFNDTQELKEQIKSDCLAVAGRFGK